MKNLLTNIALAVYSCVLFLLVIEIGLRVSGLQTVKPNPPKIYEQSENPDISYKLKPNLKDEKAYKATVSTDENGFRINSESRIANHKSQIAIIGDSIAFGYGVNDNQTLAAKLSTINAAVPGYQLQQQRALYEDYVADLDPDAVMIVFYWNDLDGHGPGILDDDGILRAHGWTTNDDDMSWLEKNSAFYKAFNKLISLRASKQSQKKVREEAVLEKTDSANIEHLETYLQDLDAFSSLLPATRYFVIWPDNELHTKTKPMLIAGAKKAGFSVIDLYEIFGNTVETLSWDTVHPSPKAIESAARFINAEMLKF